MIALLAARLRNTGIRNQPDRSDAADEMRAVVHGATPRLAKGAAIDVFVTREPGGTALGDRLRDIFVEPNLRIDPLSEAMLVSASRAQHVSEVIEPALRGGTWVLCDRFSAATLAYQGYGRGVPLDTLQRLTQMAAGGLRPDLTLLLDVPISVSRARVAARLAANAGGGGAADRLEREDDDFHSRVRDGYLALAQNDPTFVVLDATLSPPRLADVARQTILARFQL